MTRASAEVWDPAAAVPASPGRPWPLVGWILTMAVAVALLSSGATVPAAVVLAVALLAVVAFRAASWTAALGLMLAVVMAVPANLYLLPAAVPIDLEPYRLVLVIVLLAWVGALVKGRSIRTRRTPLDVPMLAFFSAVLISLAANAGSLVAEDSLGVAVKAALYVLTLLLVYHLMVSVVIDERRELALVRFLVGTAAVLSVLAALERATGYNVFRHLGEFVPLLRAVDPESGFGILRGGLRASGSAAHPIAFAALMGLVLPFAVELAFEDGHTKGRVLGAVAACLIGMGMLVTVSRTAVVAAAVVLVALMVLQPKQRATLAVAAVGLLFAVHMLFPGVMSSVVGDLTPSFILKDEVGNPQGRLADYPRIFAEFEKHPVAGEGSGTFLPAKTFYVDNQYLKFVVELGAVGTAVVVVLFIATVAVLFKAARRLSGLRRALVGASAVSCLVFVVTSATYDSFGFPQPTYLFFALSGLGVAIALNAGAFEQAGAHLRALGGASWT